MFLGTLSIPRRRYQEELCKKVEGFKGEEQPTQPDNGKVNLRWLHIEKSVRETANTILGEKPKIRSDGKIHSEVIDNLTKQSRDLKLRIQNLDDNNEIKKLKKERNRNGT